MTMATFVFLALTGLLATSLGQEAAVKEVELKPAEEISGPSDDFTASESQLMDFIMNLPGVRNASIKEISDENGSRERANNQAGYEVKIPVMKLNRTEFGRQLPIHPANMLLLQQQQQQQQQQHALAIAQLNQQLLHSNNKNRFGVGSTNTRDRNNYEDDDSSEEEEADSEEYFPPDGFQEPARGAFPFPLGPGFRSDIPSEGDSDHLDDPAVSHGNTSETSPQLTILEVNNTQKGLNDPTLDGTLVTKLDRTFQPEDPHEYTGQSSGTEDQSYNIPSSPSTPQGEQHPSDSAGLIPPMPAELAEGTETYSAIYPVEAGLNVAQQNDNQGGSAAPAAPSEFSDSNPEVRRGVPSVTATRTNLNQPASVTSELEANFEQVFKSPSSRKKNSESQTEDFVEKTQPARKPTSHADASNEDSSESERETTVRSRLFKRSSSSLNAEDNVPSTTACNNLRNCWCGTATTKIVSAGAVSVQTSLFPWLVSIRSNGVHLCTGNIISSNYILTAASCVHRIPANMLLVTTSLTSRKQKSQKVEKVVTYNGNLALPKEHEIALIKTREPMIPSRHLKYACLPQKFNETKHQRGMLVTLANDVATNKLTLIQTAVDQSSSKKCKQVGSSSKTLTFCSAPRKRTCNADIGGSFVTRGKSYSFVTTGISTGSPGCKKTGKPTTYTRIEPYMDWILKETADTFMCRNRNVRDTCSLSRVLEEDTLPEKDIVEDVDA